MEQVLCWTSTEGEFVDPDLEGAFQGVLDSIAEEENLPEAIGFSASSRMVSGLHGIEATAHYGGMGSRTTIRSLIWSGATDAWHVTLFFATGNPQGQPTAEAIFDSVKLESDATNAEATFSPAGLSDPASFPVSPNRPLHRTAPPPVIGNDVVRCVLRKIQTDDMRFVHFLLNFGTPWPQGSVSDHGFITSPYAEGPKLERLTFAATRVRNLWLVPITETEKEYKKRRGVEALEELVKRSPESFSLQVARA